MSESRENTSKINRLRVTEGLIAFCASRRQAGALSDANSPWSFRVALLDLGHCKPDGKPEQSFTGSLNEHYSPMTAAKEYAAPLTH